MVALSTVPISDSTKCGQAPIGQGNERDCDGWPLRNERTVMQVGGWGPSVALHLVAAEQRFAEPSQPTNLFIPAANVPGSFVMRMRRLRRQARTIA